MSEETFTGAEIAKIVGTTPRTIQQWAEGEVLKATQNTKKKGKGVHRRYARKEIKFAELANRLYTMDTPIKEIHATTNRIRRLNFKSLIEKFQGFVDAGKDEAIPLTKFQVWDALMEAIDTCALLMELEGPKHLLLVYSTDGQIKVRFWFEGFGQFGGSVFNWAQFAVDDWAGFKVIPFDDDFVATTFYRNHSEEELQSCHKLAEDMFRHCIKMLSTSVDYAKGKIEAYGPAPAEEREAEAAEEAQARESAG